MKFLHFIDRVLFLDEVLKARFWLVLIGILSIFLIYAGVKRLNDDDFTGLVCIAVAIWNIGTEIYNIRNGHYSRNKT